MNKYKVFIVDDEILIAKGLQTTIDWDQLGCVVCGIATNGLDAKRMIGELEPDIVISDIIMPKMSGLELVEYLHFYHKNIKCILLTAHEEFSYAKKAIQYGVEEYIVKPIDKGLIIGSIRKIVIKLKYNQSSQENIYRLNHMINEAKPIITNTILFDIAIHGNNDIDTMDKRLQNFNINIGKGSVIFFKQEKREGIEEFNEFAINGIIHNVFNKFQGKYLLKKQNKNYIIITKTDINLPDKIIKNRLLDLCMEVCRKCEDNLQLIISGAIGKLYNNIYQIHESYVSGLVALDYQFFENSLRVLHIDDIPQDGIVHNYVDYMPLYHAIQGGDSDEVKIKEDQFLFDLLASKNKHYCKERVKALIMQIYGWIEGQNKFENYLYSVEEIVDVAKFETLGINLRKFIQWTLEKFDDRRKYTTAIYDTLQIIQKRYYEKNISLQLISAEIGVSAAHLSRTFKQETNINFIDYLTEIRVEQAKKLLREGNQKINEIAETVGFYDARYFSRVFKNKCKVTPGEYRKNEKLIIKG